MLNIIVYKVKKWQIKFLIKIEKEYCKKSEIREQFKRKIK